MHYVGFTSCDSKLIPKYFEKKYGKIIGCIKVYSRNLTYKEAKAHVSHINSTTCYTIFEDKEVEGGKYCVFTFEA